MNITMPNPRKGKKKKKRDQVTQVIKLIETEYDFERMWPASLLSPNEILLWSKSFSAKKKKRAIKSSAGKSYIHHIRSLWQCLESCWSMESPQLIMNGLHLYSQHWLVSNLFVCATQINVHVLFKNLVKKHEDGHYAELLQHSLPPALTWPRDSRHKRNVYISHMRAWTCDALQHDRPYYP